MRDRAMQALYLLSLDPLAETLADPNSYGFRTHRAPADAIEQCFTVLAKKASPQRSGPLGISWFGRRPRRGEGISLPSPRTPHPHASETLLTDRHIAPNRFL